VPAAATSKTASVRVAASGATSHADALEPRRLSAGGSGGFSVGVRPWLAHSFPDGHSCSNLDSGRPIQLLPVTNESSVTWNPAPSNLPSKANLSLVSVGEGWSASQVQTFPAPFTIRHDAGCQQTPTLELGLGTTVPSLVLGNQDLETRLAAIEVGNQDLVLGNQDLETRLAAIEVVNQGLETRLAASEVELGTSPPPPPPPPSPPPSLPSQCTSYASLAPTGRTLGDIVGAPYTICDSGLAPNWYRVQDGYDIATSPAYGGGCSTQGGGYWPNALPTSPGETISGKWCFAYVGSSCHHTQSTGYVTHCGTYFVWYLLTPAGCNYAYCVAGDPFSVSL